MSVITVSADSHELFDRIRDYMSQDEFERVRAAFLYASDKHSDQWRKSGEPYVTHPATVAYYLAQYQLDSAALIAALLHDVAEDTPASIPDIEAQFGHDVAQIVDGVTKFKKSAEHSHDGEQSAKDAHNQTVRKLFQFMTRDVRVVMIKLFDRLHNMRTIGAMPQHKKERIANETLAIYAPLANRLGMWDVKNELERLSFQIVNLPAYQKIKQQLNARRNAHQMLTNQVCKRVEKQFRDQGIDVVRVCPSPRNAYTIYSKHRESNPDSVVDHIPRLLVVVRDRLTCYTGLGVLHDMWQPIPGDFDDYIARPRDNLYQALHTTVRHESGRLLKFRLRTEAMAVMSEIGVLGRWASVGRDMAPEMAAEMAEHVAALFASIDSNISAEDVSGTAVQNVLADILGRQITVYTPKGDPRELPQNATPLDLAYKIHTQIGNTAHRARVNGELKPLNIALKDGDTVEILRRSQSPQRMWLEEELGFLKTGSARSTVKRNFRRLPELAATRQGRTLLEQELVMLGLPDFKHAAIADLLGFDEPEGLYYAIGRAELMLTEVARRVLSHAWWYEGPTRQIGRKITSHENETFLILGASDVHEKLHLCGNCKPRPGADIRGYIRKSKRVTVHRLTCHLLPPETEAGKLLELSWGEAGSGEVREALLQIEVYDRPNLLFEITDMLRSERVNISWINTPNVRGQMRVDLCLEVISSRQLVGLLHRIKSLINVRAVRNMPQAVKPS